MSLKPLFLFACTVCALPLMAQKNYTLTSPDGTLQATVATGSDLRISLSADGETLLAPSPVSMTLGGGEVLGSNPKVTRARKNTADARIASPFYKKSSVRDHYNELELTMRGDYGLVVRLYDDGLAYRFTTRKKDGFLVENEQVAYTFPLCRAQAAARFRRAVPQFVREHLHPSPADAARPPQTDLPARAGGTSRRPQDGHHRGRPAGLSGPLPQQLDGGPRAEGRVRPLS